MRSCEECIRYQDCFISTLGVCGDFSPRDIDDIEDEDLIVGVD